MTDLDKYRTSKPEICYDGEKLTRYYHLRYHTSASSSIPEHRDRKVGLPTAVLHGSRHRFSYQTYRAVWFGEAILTGTTLWNNLSSAGVEAYILTVRLWKTDLVRTQTIHHFNIDSIADFWDPVMTVNNRFRTAAKIAVLRCPIKATLNIQGPFEPKRI